MEASDTSGSVAHEEQPLWGRLVSLNDKFANIELRDDNIIIGRSAAAKVVIESPAVSGKHCTITREQTFLATKDGTKVQFTVMLKDTSTNGTFVNGELVGKENRKPIFDGYEITVQPKKLNAEKIAFVFQDCKKEEEEMEQGGPQGIYQMKKELGTGTFATVKLAVNRTTGEEVAIKVIDKNQYIQKNKRKGRDSLMDEVKVLTAISHPNVLQIKGVFETPSTLYMVLELALGGDLFDRVAQGGQPEPVAKEIFTQMLLAIKYLHAQGIVHRDLKPENILLSLPDKNDIKISDFGLSRIIDENTYMKSVCGTPQYVAPEILSKGAEEGYGKAVDMWSLGVILFILLSGYPPFDEDKERRITLFEKIKSGKFTMNPKYWKHVSDDAKDLIRKLLVVDPATRYTAEQALAHIWIAGPSSNGSNTSSTAASGNANTNSDNNNNNNNSNNDHNNQSNGNNSNNNTETQPQESIKTEKSTVKKEKSSVQKKEKRHQKDETKTDNAATAASTQAEETKQQKEEKESSNDENSNNDNDNGSSTPVKEEKQGPISARRKRKLSSDGSEEKKKKEAGGKKRGRESDDDGDDAEDNDSDNKKEGSGKEEKEKVVRKRGRPRLVRAEKTDDEKSPTQKPPTGKKRGRKPKAQKEKEKEKEEKEKEKEDDDSGDDDEESDYEDDDEDADEAKREPRRSSRVNSTGGSSSNNNSNNRRSARLSKSPVNTSTRNGTPKRTASGSSTKKSPNKR